MRRTASQLVLGAAHVASNMLYSKQKWLNKNCVNFLIIVQLQFDYRKGKEIDAMNYTTRKYGTKLSVTEVIGLLVFIGMVLLIDVEFILLVLYFIKDFVR